MSAYKTDREYSDKIFPLVKSYLDIFFGVCTITHPTVDEDNNNNVDYFVNGNPGNPGNPKIPIQFRVQDYRKRKCNMNYYYPTLRYSRENSRSNIQKLSEFFKIKDNKLKGELYPHYLIWCIFDGDICKKMIVIDLTKFFNDIDKYEIKGQNGENIENCINTGHQLTLRKNLDDSSEFIVLTTHELVSNTSKIYDFKLKKYDFNEW